MNLYTSDPHLGHTNIIKYTERPFGSLFEMDEALVMALRRAEELGPVYCMGDVSFNLASVLERFGPIFQKPELHTLVVGNHDRVEKRLTAYEATFGQIVGTEKSWKTNTLMIEEDGFKLLLSHRPQEDLQGCDLNIYGHVHNDATMNEGHRAEELWAAKSERHICCCVEVTEYEPKPLNWLLDHRSGQLKTGV